MPDNKLIFVFAGYKHIVLTFTPKNNPIRSDEKADVQRFMVYVKLQ